MRRSAPAHTRSSPAGLTRPRGRSYFGVAKARGFMLTSNWRISQTQRTARPHGWPGQAHGCPARFVLEGVHGIDSTRFQLVANHLDTRGDQSRAAPEYRFSWTSEADSVGDPRSACGATRCRSGSARLEDQVSSDRDAVRAVVRRAEPARDRHQSAKPCRQALSSWRLHGFQVDACDRQCVASGGSIWRSAFGADWPVAARI